MSSSDADWDPGVDQSSESPISQPPASPRKRRRSHSAGSPPAWKREITPYNDAYRLLYNDFVETTCGERIADSSLQASASQIGASVWTSSEKAAFFAALDRLGKDNLPSIANAVGSKSTSETRRFLLRLQETLSDRIGKRDNSNVVVSLRDTPAASEISVACETQLETEGDALARMQEQFEATQEQKRYGEYWLITPDLADQIEVAVGNSRVLAAVDEEAGHDRTDAGNPSILQEIPEATLLIPKNWLGLSKNLFMNPSPTFSYPWPNWRDVGSELSTEPSMYRTAFRDFHALVHSLSRRIVQTALIQATSRIRSQGFRAKKGASPFVRRRDVHTAVDVLGLKRTIKQYWRDVPRRCRVQVATGKHRKYRELSWDEVERFVESIQNRKTPLGSDTDTQGPISETEDENFKSRAIRSGTPLPSDGHLDDESSERDHTEEHPDFTDPDTDQHSELASQTSITYSTEDDESLGDPSEDELEDLEKFDRQMSRQEEQLLWSIVDRAPAASSPELKEQSDQPKTRKSRLGKTVEVDDWRSWTHYHAEWEEFRDPVPANEFLKNQKSPSPVPARAVNEDYDTDYGTQTGMSSAMGKDKRSGGAELHIRDSRAYAAMQSRIPLSEERDMGSDDSLDDAQVPTQSIEAVVDVKTSTLAMEGDAMDWEPHSG